MDALGIEDAHVIGHSYGGALTMALVAAHPERVRSMVLVDSAAVDYPLNRRKWFAAVPPFNWIYVRGLALRAGSIRRLFERAFYDDALVTEELVEAYLERLRVEGAARAYRGLTRPRPASRWSREVRYEELYVPTLVVWGAEDQVANLEQGRAHAELLPDHRFVAIEAAGHSPMEEKPTQFVEAVTAFLADVESSKVAGGPHVRSTATDEVQFASKARTHETSGKEKP
jgi:2-hydroxymuconate-semialdehyde hydrolase